MKTVVFEIKAPVDGDLVILNAEDRRGGKSSVKHRVLGARQLPKLDDDGFVTGTVDIPAQTPRDVALALADQINRDWMPECARARVKDDTGALIVNCSDLYAYVDFTTEVHGTGGTTVGMTEY